ncbi:MAG: lysophospholipid acyltransferase family protein, partial [Candidatus Binatia bacterium]
YRRFKQAGMRLLGALAAPLFRAWIALVRSTSRVHFDDLSRRLLADVGSGQDVVLVSLHQKLAHLPLFLGRSRMQTLISLGDLGNLIAAACHAFGYDTIRGGSSSRKSRRVPALDNVTARVGTRKGEGVFTYLTPDGSRGPAGACKAGFVHVAARNELPIYCVNLCSRRSLHVPSWDRLAIPLPFNEIWVDLEGPFSLPRGAGLREFEGLRLRAEAALHRMHDRAFGRFGRDPLPRLQARKPLAVSTELPAVRRSSVNDES